MPPRRRIKRDYRPHGPARREHPLSVEEVPEHRNLCCGLYAICLGVVVKRRWVSFTCRSCSLWSRDRASTEAGPARVIPLRNVLP